MSEPSTFFAPGIPRPKGSTKSFVVKKGPKAGKVVTTSTNENLKPWQATVALAASAAKLRPVDGAVKIEITFALPRPRGHYGKNGLLASAPKQPATKPDLDKLVRAIFDALTGVAWNDDAQVVWIGCLKLYADGGACGALITVSTTEDV